MIFVYLLQSIKDESYYSGVSENPLKRLAVHNRGGLRVTASKRPWKIVYQKAHQDYLRARKHEKWLKKKNRDYKANLAG